MESNWRWNVAEQGLLKWGINKCARLLHPFGFFQWVYRGAGINSEKAVGNHSILATGEIIISTAGYSGPLNFPYGFEVEPDQT